MKQFKQLVFALLFFWAGMSSTFAEPVVMRSTGVTPLHAKAIHALLTAMRVTNLFTAVISNLKTSPEEKEFAASFMARTSDEEIYMHLIPIYAKYINEQQAIELTHAYNSSFMRKMQGHILAGAMGKPAPPLPFFTPAEQAEFRRFQSLSSARIFNDSQAKIGADAKTMWANWGRTYGLSVRDKVFATIAKGTEAINKSDDKPGGATFNVERVGISYVDKFIMIVLNSTLKLYEADKHFSADLVSNGYGNILLPTNIVTQRGIDEGKASLEASEASAERLLREIDTLFKQRIEELATLNFPSKADFMQDLESSSVNVYDYLIKLGEKMRGQVDIRRRILSFAQSRLGETKVVDGKLILSTDADVEMYNGLVAQYNALNADYQEFLAQRQSKERGFLNQDAKPGTKK